MAANTMLKRVRAITQPCFTPFVTGNESEVSPLSITVALMPSCNWRTSIVNQIIENSEKSCSHNNIKWIQYTQ